MSAPTPPVEEREASAQSALVDWAGRAGRALAVALGSVLFAFVVGGVIVVVTKGNPLLAYQSLICGGFGVFCVNGENPALQLSFTLVFTTPLILAGLAVAVAFRAGLFNIGAEGQFVMGAIATTIVGIKVANWPAWALLPLVLVAGTLAGALWGGLVGLLKATTGAHEVVTTIMLNFVALWLLRYLIVGGPLQAPSAFNASPSIGTGAQLPPLIQGNGQVFDLPASVFQAHTGIFVALLAALVYSFLLRRTSLGYEIRAVGQSQRAARYGGVSIPRTIIVTMLISGAFAGLAGAVQIAGVDHRLVDIYFSDTTGFDAIAVALLGQTTGIGVVLAAILFGALHSGSRIMQLDANISGSLVFVLEALVLFSLAANFLRTVKVRLPALGRRPAAPTGAAIVESGAEAESSLVADSSRVADSGNTA
jgi:general nucleoside transport system permease protein